MPDVTLTTLQSLKQSGEKIAMLTCYDATFAKVACQAGVDVLLVGDSLGMVLQGHDSTLQPHALLDALQRIEQEQGRTRKAERWGPRTLDLDILLFGNRILDDARLQVPHYHMHARPFVLYPLAELAPELLLPDGRALGELLAACPFVGLERLDDKP